jgi:hypothetical protein
VIGGWCECQNKQDVLTDFQWKPQPAAEAWVRDVVAAAFSRIFRPRGAFADHMLCAAGVRFTDIGGRDFN